MTQCLRPLRYLVVLCAPLLIWAQAPDDAQREAKRQAERLHLGALPQGQTANANNGVADQVQKKAAEAMHSPLLRIGSAGPVVKDKPYAALAVTETVQSLIDGNRIVRRNVTKHYRDRMGRTRREQTIESLGPSSPIPPVQLVVISDPITGLDYIADAARMIVRKFPRFETVPLDENPNPRSNESSLGMRTMEGLECIGARRVVTIPAGQIGNVLPIEIITESWYSPAIEALVRSTTSDPRFGQTTYTLQNIVLDEPQRHFFELPPGYKVEFEGRSGVMMNRTRSPLNQ